MKKFLVSFMFFVCSLSMTFAQGSISYSEHLSGVKISADIESLQALSSIARVENVVGYRVCIYTGNDQNARSAAGGAVGQMSRLFGDVPTNMIYNSPVFKVHTGACLTRTEATILLGRLRPYFPNAFIVNERLSLESIATMPGVLETSPTTSTVEE